ncbi:MAG TPA: M20/M25/M40 family metallo-hydrolase, partial [Gemmataceae bacterium]|nr:M20/M25/M40 family metallo-hydrolase [Gemmataceae bacterium]
DVGPATDRLLRYLSVEGITGQEKAIAQAVVTDLTAAGVRRAWIHFDRANDQIPLPTQTGNLIVLLPGTRRGPRRLFATHLDTVPLCAGARPVRRGGRIQPAGATALGGDNRTGVACLVTLAATLLERRLPHPPLTLLFTVREESGLWGARFADPAELGDPAEGYNVDGADPAAITVGAVGAERWEVEIMGRASHAGVHPERGISATAVAALAVADVVRGGWFGKVVQDGGEGTSNVGSVAGRDGTSAGEATNVVTDYVHVKGESRSHDTGFARTITAAYRDAFRRAAEEVRDDRGRKARVRFQARRDYYPFRLKPTAPVVRHAVAAAESIGLGPTLRVGNGGLDANWLVRHGIPTITFGAGQRAIHTTEEYVELSDFADGCRLALALATRE